MIPRTYRRILFGILSVLMLVPLPIMYFNAVMSTRAERGPSDDAIGVDLLYVAGWLGGSIAFAIAAFRGKP